jgi:hypothetical protein
MRFDTADNAKNAHGMATAGLQQGKAMMPPPVQTIADKVKLTASGNDVLLALQLSGADLQSLAATLGPMMGGMMMGAGAAHQTP